MDFDKMAKPFFFDIRIDRQKLEMMMIGSAGKIKLSDHVSIIRVGYDVTRTKKYVGPSAGWREWKISFKAGDILI